MEITPGLRLGPYKILRLLGSGGMGSVYLAYDERLERHVALKMLTREPREGAARRVLREARAVARLNHPNIAGLYDVFEHDHEAVLVMEYVDGDPLTSLVKSQPVPVDRALDIGLQLVDALRYAHRARIIHRDIKPANVMLTHDGKVKVLDLGLARATVDPGADTQTESETEPVPSRAGTPAYMAPERLVRHAADERTDVYSVGVVLFELLTGRRPYVAPDLMALAVNVATQSTPRVADTRPDVPPILDDLIARAMAKDPATRYASAAELHDGLVRVRETLAGRLPKPPEDGRQTWRKRVLVGAGAIAVLAVAAWLMFRGPSSGPASGPATLAIPPVINASTDQADLNELGSLLQSVLSRNLAALSGVTIVPAPVSSPGAQTPAPAQVSRPAPFTLSVTIRRAVSGLAGEAGIRGGGDTQPLRVQFSGDELGVFSSALDELATALQQRLAPNHRSTDVERTQLRELPTRDRQALASYLRGRGLLDISDDLKTDARAIEAFQDAIKRDGSFAFAHAGLSQAYWSTWRHARESSWLDRALAAGRQAAAIDPRCDQAYVALALAFRGHRQKDNAIAEARRAAGLSPDNDDARRVLGLTLLDDAQADAALVELRAAVALRPHRAVNHYYLGWGLLTVQRNQEAIAPLKEATELQPNFESAWVNLGLAYLREGDYERASGSSSRALELDRNDTSALNNLATAYYWDGKYELALQRFQEAAALDPESVIRQMNLGDALDALSRSREARAAYAKAVDLATGQLRKKFDARIAGMAAKCEAKLAHKAEAELLANQAWEAGDKDAEVAYKVATVYALTGQPERAFEKLDLAVKLGKPRWEVRADPDLRSLRADARFKALVAKPDR